MPRDNDNCTLLRRGNELCRRREMTPKLIEQVKHIYEKGMDLDETTLINASRRGFGDMVWGFIKCAKQTGQTMDLHTFLGYTDSHGQTALDVVAKEDRYRVIQVLLEHVSVHHLVSNRDDEGKTPLSLLRDSKYDEYILKAMKKAAPKRETDPSISINIDNKHQEPVVYKECIMAVNSYPKSHKNITRSSLDSLNESVCELTPKQNTILHLISEFGDVNYLQDLLKKHPTLIHHENSDGETPFYVAARAGNIDILEIMINYARPDELVKLSTRSKDRYNALHIAIQNHHVGVVYWLVKEIPQLANQINEYNVSPLYLAVERDYNHIVRLILDECKETAFDGPDGKNALHAAAIIRKAYCTKHLLLKNKDLLYIHDKQGWTPLHYAAHYDKVRTIKVLLKEDPNIGFQMTTGDDKSYSAIHIAASQGHVDSLKVIIDKCLGCSEMIDAKGRNILHIAVESKRENVIKFIFEHTKLQNLINERDSNGDTPIHLFMASDFELEKMVIDYKVINIHVRNNENLTPLDMTSSDDKKDKLIKAIETGVAKQKESASKKQKSDFKINESRKEKATKLGGNAVLVVALIATATFAAAFAVPGGFDGDDGMPILLRKAAYKAFVFANALAFSSSFCVLAAHIRLQFYIDDLDKDEDAEEDRDGTVFLIFLQYLFTGIAMIAMGVAFITGSYVILAPSLGFAISICVTCLCIMLPFSILSRKHLRFIFQPLID